MKIAILCEGHSEFESVPVILNSLGISYHLLQSRLDSCPSSFVFNVYRHNYKGVSSIRKEYINFSKHLIGALGFSKVIIWFDNGKLIPICEYAFEQKKLIGSEYENQIVLLLAVRALENWIISSSSILCEIFGKQRHEIDEVLNACGDIENANAEKVLNKLALGTPAETWIKQERSVKFFSRVNMIGSESFASKSFSRFITKIKCMFLEPEQT